MNIQSGDLVVVVRDCCGIWIGSIFKVGTIQQPQKLLCACGCIGKHAFATNANDKRPHAAPLHWLRRIDPLPESETHRNEVTA